MAERHLLVIGCLLWYVVRVFPFNLKDDWSKPEERKEMTTAAVAKAEKESSYYVVLKNELWSEVYYSVSDGGEAAEGYVASRSEKCVVLPSVMKIRDVHVAGYVWYEENDAYKFVTFTNSFPVPRGSICSITCIGGRNSFVCSNVGSQGKTTVEELVRKKPPPADSDIVFTREEFEESTEIYTDITNDLPSSISVTLSCMLLHVSTSQPPVGRKRVDVWEEQVPAGTKLHRVKLKKAWIQYAIDRPWVMTMSGEVDGFGRFSCRVEPLNASDTDHHLNRHSHYELSLKHDTEKPGIGHVAAVQMKATITKLNSEHHTYTKECAKMEE